MLRHQFSSEATEFVPKRTEFVPKTTPLLPQPPPPPPQTHPDYFYYPLEQGGSSGQIHERMLWGQHHEEWWSADQASQYHMMMPREEYGAAGFVAGEHQEQPSWFPCDGFWQDQYEVAQPQAPPQLESQPDAIAAPAWTDDSIILPDLIIKKVHAFAQASSLLSALQLEPPTMRSHPKMRRPETIDAATGGFVITEPPSIEPRSLLDARWATLKFCGDDMAPLLSGKCDNESIHDEDSGEEDSATPDKLVDSDSTSTGGSTVPGSPLSRARMPAGAVDSDRFPGAIDTESVAGSDSVAGSEELEQASSSHCRATKAVEPPRWPPAQSTDRSIVASLNLATAQRGNLKSSFDDHEVSEDAGAMVVVLPEAEFCPGPVASMDTLLEYHHLLIAEKLPDLLGIHSEVVPETPTGDGSDQWRAKSEFCHMHKHCETVLTRSENAYKIQGAATRESELERRVLALLNKICPENLSIIVDRLARVELRNAMELEQVIRIVHGKALTESSYCETYADMVFSLRARYPEFPPQAGGQNVSFRRILLRDCLQIKKNSQEVSL